MKKCAQCQAPLDPAWKFCVNCGTPNPANDQAAPLGGHMSGEQSPLPSREHGQPQTRAAAKAAAASATVVKPKRTKPPAAVTLTEEIPAAIRNSQDGPPAIGRRRVDAALIVSISLGIAGAALIVYLVILVFGTRG